MPVYNPNTHNRHSTRLEGYDYGTEGFYFLTICCKDRINLFGEIIQSQMILNEYGEIVKRHWIETPTLRPNIQLHDYVIMPNHFHAIIEIMVSQTPSLINNTPVDMPKPTSQTLGSIIRGFKSSVSKEIGDSIWQRNYHDHVIRDEKELEAIRKYIHNNPIEWHKDINFETLEQRVVGAF